MVFVWVPWQEPGELPGRAGELPGVAIGREGKGGVLGKERQGRGDGRNFKSSVFPSRFCCLFLMMRNDIFSHMSLWNVEKTAYGRSKRDFFFFDLCLSVTDGNQVTSLAN